MRKKKPTLFTINAAAVKYTDTFLAFKKTNRDYI